MGNCCGKSSSDDDNFQGQGRTLGAGGATTAPTTASLPANKTISPPQAGRSMGKNAQEPGQSAGPREAAAKAAEERAKSSTQGKGKLGRQLDSQRAQTQTETLAQTARDNVAARDADAAAQARNYN